MPPGKRQRISRACEPCRTRKSKCDGEHPSCLMCQSAGRKCVYANSTKRRGLQSGYVRGLETLLGLIVRCHPDTEIQIERLLRRQETKDCLLGGRDGESCIKSWRNSASFRKIHSVIQNQSSDLEDDSPVPEDDATATSPMRPSCDSRVGDASTETSFPQGKLLPGFQTNSIIEHTREKSGTNASDFIDLFKQPFPPNTIELMEEYFAYTHSWFPILERQNLLRIMHGQPESKAHNRQVIDTGHRMSLWALIAYTLSSQPRSSHRHAILTPQNLEISIRAHALVDDENFSIGHVQSVLILALLRLKNGHIHATWMLTTQAVRMIEILGHMTHSKRYKRVFQGCIILENFISMLLDRRPCFSDDQLANNGIFNNQDEEDEDGLEEWDIWTFPPQNAVHFKEGIPSRSPLRALSTFKIIFQLMCHSSKFSSHQIKDTEIIDSDLQILQNWRQNLPAYLQWTDSPDSLKPPILVLHLSINFVISTLLIKSCAVEFFSMVLCAETVKLSIELLEKYLELTGNPWVPPLFLGFVTQARKLIDLYMSKSRDQTCINLSETLQRIMDSTQSPGDLKDRMVYWKRLPLGIPTLTCHGNTEKPSTSQMQAVEESELYSDMMGSVDLVDHTDMSREVPFEALCEQIVASYPLERSFPDSSFARNLGFLHDSVDDDLLNFLDQPLGKAGYEI